MSEAITGASGAATAVDEGGVDVAVDVNAVIAKFQSQLTAQEATPSPEAVPDGSTPSSAALPTPVAQAAAAAAAPAPETPAAETPKAEEPTLRARQLAALARIEEEARAAKAHYEELTRKLEQKPQEPAVKPPASLDEFRELLELDPDAAFASIGVSDKNSVAVRLMYAALGEDAPPEVKAEIEKKRMQAELAALKRKVDKQDKGSQDALHQAAYAARVEATDRELSSFAQAVPSEFKFLAAEASQNAAEVYQGLCTIAASQIQAGKFLSAREAAQVLETQLAADYARLSRAVNPAPPPTSQPAPAQSPPRTMETLSDADTRGRPGLSDQPTAQELTDPEYWVRKAEAKLKALGYNSR